MVAILVGPFTKAAYRWNTTMGTLEVFCSLKAVSTKKCKPEEVIALTTAESNFQEVDKIVCELDQQREERLLKLLRPNA